MKVSDYEISLGLCPLLAATALAYFFLNEKSSKKIKALKKIAGGSPQRAALNPWNSGSCLAIQGQGFIGPNTQPPRFFLKAVRLRT